jgi:hypothetical protein
MNAHEDAQGDKVRASPNILDMLGGAALGLFVGILVGLSTTPIVSIVITALVALLAGFFGLSEKSSFAPSPAGIVRLAGFGLVASLATLIGVWIRTHETLAPSIAEQKEMLRTIGYDDHTNEQRDLLKYLRYGLLPSGVTEAKSTPRIGVLFSTTAPDFCSDLARLTSPLDSIQILEGDSRLRTLALKLRAMPPEKQRDSVDIIKMVLCPDI